LNSDENSKLHDEFIENITNFYIPLGVALISDKWKIQHDSYAIEESSVVAAASNPQNFGPKRWFQSNRYQYRKNRSVHFMYTGDPSKLALFCR
jgi:hypothetical protein